MSNEWKGEIVVPTLKLQEQMKPFIDEIEVLREKIENINIYNPLATFRVIKSLQAERHKLKKEYIEKVTFSYLKLNNETVSAPAFALTDALIHTFSLGFSAIFQLQSAWNELESLMDRKFALSYAILALYIAIFSIIITIFLGIIH